MRARAFAGLIAVVLGTVSLSCAALGSPGGREAAEAPSPAAPKRITAAIITAPPTFSQAINGGGGQSFGFDVVERLVNPGLTLEDATGTLRAILAEDVPSLDNGLWKLLPDGRMETTWRIREGALWHDGTRVTAEDLLFTASVAQDLELSLDFAGFLAKARAVEGIDAFDHRTLTVKWKEPHIQANALFTLAPMPKHLLERAYLENKATFAALPYWAEAFVGTGPFVGREFARGSHVAMEAFHRYVLGRPKVDQILVKFLTDPNALAANIFAGEVDLTLGRGISIEQAKEIADQWPQGKMAIALGNWIAIYPQMIDPSPTVILDLRFRRALLHAIDRQQMADQLQAGLVPVAHSFVNPNTPEHKAIEQRTARYEYDVRRTAQLIEEVGYTRGADGFYRDAANQRLSVEVRAFPRPINEKATFAVADYWHRVGVGVEPLVVPQQRTRDLAYLYTRPGFELTGNPNGWQDLIRFHSRQAPLPENNFAGGNRARYRHPELDALIDRFYTTIPGHERVQVLGDIVHHMTDQLNVMGLFHDGSPAVVSHRLESTLTHGSLPTTGSNAHEWDVK